MTERDKILVIQVILSYVEEIGEGEEAPGPLGIRHRLRMYDKNLDKVLGKKADRAGVASRPVRLRGSEGNGGRPG
jgi:hypothetical protein